MALYLELEFTIRVMTAYITFASKAEKPMDMNCNLAMSIVGYCIVFYSDLQSFSILY